MNKIINAATSVALLALAAIPLVAVGSLAHAAETQTGVHVKVGDLKLDHAIDASTFQARVDVAARSLCAASSPMVMARSRCVGAVREEAIAKLSQAQRRAFELSISSAQPRTLAAR